jgi:hypothetical protein
VVTVQTISERLFESLCESLGIACDPIPRSANQRTADYRLTLAQTSVIAEVKQLDPSPEDARIARELAERGRAGGCYAPGRRIRQEITDSYKQLRRESDGRYPAVLVLYDNTGGGTGCIAAHDVLTAMYGEEYVEVRVAADTGDEAVAFRAGGNRGVTPQANRALSAVAVLRAWSGTPVLEIYHNRYAARPLNAESLRHDRVSHFAVSPERDGAFLEWCPC